jgi:peptidoglycan biosynthesis protein MviN/MurJ (putative lipid II flippase)
MEENMYAGSFHLPRQCTLANRQHSREREKHMPLIELLIVLVVMGVVLWLINTYIPMQANIKKIVKVVVVIVAILFVLSAFGILDSASRFRIG